jgi:hypothetical protein
MKLIPETGHYFSQSSNQDVFFSGRVEGMPMVKTAGNWFYNYETDKFISKSKFIQKLENDELINKSNKKL